MKVERMCDNCAFDMGPAWDDCTFPDPQDETEPPLMASAVMPDRNNEGRNCLHFRARKSAP
jgi:hypothetical protein